VNVRSDPHYRPRLAAVAPPAARRARRHRRAAPASSPSSTPRSQSRGTAVPWR